MKRGGGLHPARADCWPPTKQPRATPGGLIAASVTCLSRREGVPPCLRTSPPLGGTLEGHRTSWRIPFPRHACIGCRTLRLESQSSAGLRMQPYPRSPDLVWPGHLHGTGCLSARAMDTGLLTVVWCLCVGLGFGCAPPLLAGVMGVCVFVFPLRLYPATPGWGVRCGCVCLGWGFGCAPPLLAGVLGCVCACVLAPLLPRHS